MISQTAEELLAEAFSIIYRHPASKDFDFVVEITRTEEEFSARPENDMVTVCSDSSVINGSGLWTCIESTT